MASSSPASQMPLQFKSNSAVEHRTLKTIPHRIELRFESHRINAHNIFKIKWQFTVWIVLPIEFYH